MSVGIGCFVGAHVFYYLAAKGLFIVRPTLSASRRVRISRSWRYLFGLSHSFVQLLP
jgi:hypothetical protein